MSVAEEPATATEIPPSESGEVGSAGGGVPMGGVRGASEGVPVGGVRGASEGVPVGGVGGRGSLMEMEVVMREQIRVLQEQRAAAMMNEVVELQRERDLAMGRVRRLERSVADLQTENTLLRGSHGSADTAERLVFLERCLLEEQLTSSDLKRKLQNADRQNGTLLLRIRRLEVERGGASSPLPCRLGQLAVEERNKSKSLNDLEKQVKQDEPVKPVCPGGIQLERVELLKADQTDEVKQPLLRRRRTMPSGSRASVRVSQSQSSSPQTYSPTVIPRRYKLAAATCRHVGTQTMPLPPATPPESDHSEDGKQEATQEELPQAILDALRAAKADVIRVQQEKQVFEVQLAENQQNQKKACESLQLESSLLRDNLTQFSQWTRQKLQLVEEDMDIFRVVYSLHGSLSQEAAMLEQLRTRLQTSEAKVAQLEVSNRYLSQAVSEAEEKYQLSQRENRHLREKLSRHLPSNSTHTHPPSPLGQNRHVHKAHRHKRHSPHTSHKHSSPLLAHRHTSTKKDPLHSSDSDRDVV